MASHAKTKGTDRSGTNRHSSERRHESRTDTSAHDQSARSCDREEPLQGEVNDIAFADFLNGKWGTAVEAYRYLSISLSVLRRETRAGRIKAYVVGGRKLVRYRRSDLDAYLESQAVVVPFTSRKRA
jgi:excisionase family DNA binding protein